MFLDDLIICMTDDASLNEMIQDRIVFDHLPANFNRKVSWIVFDYELEDTISTLDQNDFAAYYNLRTQIISPNIEDTIDIFERMNTYLTSYDDGKIRAITQQPGDTRDFDSEERVYYKNANYSILYTG